MGVHLRPLVQPLFFQLGCEQDVPAGAGKSLQMASAEAELVVSWPVFVAKFAELLRDGTDWSDLLGVWVDNEGDPAQVEAAAELALALCFWCAHPSRVPGSESSGAASTLASTSASGDGARSSTEPPGLIFSIIRPSIVEALAASGSNGAIAAVTGKLAANIPSLTSGIGSLLRQALLDIPHISEPALPESRILDAGLAFVLRGFSDYLWESDMWDPLYRDWCDGRSFNGLLKGVLHYEGIGLLLVSGAGGEVLGAVSNSWEDGNGNYGGGSECCLFALLPELKGLRSTGRSQNFAYLNSRNKHAPRGLGFGGQVGCFRLGVDADFEECQVLESEATYQSGRLLPGSAFQVGFKIRYI